MTVHAQGQDVTPTRDATGDNPPTQPTNLQASATHDSVSLTWEASSDQTVTHYAVLRRNRDTDALGVFQVIDGNAGSGTSYTDASVSAESKYGYRVKAVSPTGVSQWSGFVKADTPAAPEPTATPTPTATPEPTTTPTPTPTPTPEPEPASEPDPASLAPANLTAGIIVDDGVSLRWDAPGEDADSVTGYEILRAQGEAELATLVADTESTDTSYTDTTATEPGESYAYRVIALRNGENSQQSNRAAVQLPNPLLLAPSNLTAGIVDDGVALGWDAPAQDSDSVTGYEILRAQGEEGLTTLVADTESTATSYTDTTATEPGETYAYRVKAVRDEEKSQGSNQAEVLIPHTPEDLAPANLTAGIVDDGVALIWDAPAQDAESVTGYDVSRSFEREPGITSVNLKPTGAVVTSWVDHDATESGVRYTYRVRAVRDGESSGWSAPAHVDLPGKESRNPKDDPPVALPQVVNESELWSTTMTVGHFSGGVIRGYEVLLSMGSLADDDFVHDGTTYTVYGLSQTSLDDTVLDLHLDKNLPTSGLFLRLGDRLLSFDLTVPFETQDGLWRYIWTGTTLGAPFTWADGESVAVSIEEPPPGVTVSSTELTLQEGSSADYTVVLDSEPTADVTITIDGHADTDVSVSPGSLTFTSGNWNTAQTVTVTAAADADAVADAPVTLTHTVPGATEYASITVTITEADTAGVTVSPTALTLVEGESGDYTVVLDSEPTADVTITLGGHSGTDVSVSPASLTFNAANWETAQTVTVTATADADAVTDSTVTLTHTGSGATEYTNVKGDEVDVNITETDTAGVTVSKTALTLLEGESGDYTLELTSEPTADVTITIGGHAGADVSVSPASLTFTAANWNTARTVTVMADHDGDLADEAAVTLSHAVSGTGEYAGVTAGSVTVNITDDDNLVSLAADAASVVEGDAATFTLTRTGYLAQARTVNVAVTETVGGGYIQDPAPTTVQFSANESTTTLTVNTNDDKVVGNSGSVRATLQTGANYGVLPPFDGIVNMTDNDTAGEVAWELMVSPDTITEGEGGTTVTLSITNGYTFADAQTVDVYSGGIPLRGVPFIGEGGTHAITIDAGDSSGSLVVIAVDDDLYNRAAGERTLPLTAWRNGTQIGNAVDLTWVDDEPPPVVTLTVSENDIVEGDTITLTSTESPQFTGRYTIDITYTDSGGVVTGTVPTKLLYEGLLFPSQTITTDNDLVDEPDAEVTFTLSNPGHPATLGTPSSVTVLVRDDDVKPGAPQSFNAVAGDTVADLTWQTGDSGSEPITKYQYRVSGDGGDNWNPDWGDIPGSGAGTTSYQVPGLRNGTGYLFQIRAVNIVGEGALARKGIGAYSTLVSAIINGREYLAPSDF